MMTSAADRLLAWSVDALTCALVCQIAIRLANAQREMEKRDAPGFFHRVIVNDELDVAYAQLKGALCCRGFTCASKQ